MEAASVCRLPVSRFQWDLEVTSNSSGGQTAAVRATLPGGDSTVDVSLAVSLSPTATSDFTANGSINTKPAPFGTEPLKASIGSGAQGRVCAGSGGRGQGQDAFLNGTITLSDAASNAIIGSCAAADHKCSLIPR